MNDWRTYLLIFAAVALFVLGHRQGYEKAALEGRSALAALRVEYAQGRRDAADAYGAALARLIAANREEAERVRKLDARLLALERQQAQKLASLRGRIADVTQNSTCVLTPGTVRLLNEAGGADGIPGDALPGPACAAESAGGTAACADSAAGISDGRGGRIGRD